MSLPTSDPTGKWNGRTKHVVAYRTASLLVPPVASVRGRGKEKRRRRKLGERGSSPGKKYASIRSDFSWARNSLGDRRGIRQVGERKRGGSQEISSQGESD